MGVQDIAACCCPIALPSILDESGNVLPDVRVYFIEGPFSPCLPRSLLPQGVAIQPMINWLQLHRQSLCTTYIIEDSHRLISKFQAITFMEVCWSEDFISFAVIFDSRLPIILFGGLFLKSYSLILIHTSRKDSLCWLSLLYDRSRCCGSDFL